MDRRALPLLAVAVTMTAAAGPESTFPPAPRLANIFLASDVDSTVIAALARWDVVVLHDSWTTEQLDELRRLNAGIKIFIYVIAYAVPLTATTPFSALNTAYVTANDLWWRDADGGIASDWPGTGMVNITSLAAVGPLGSYKNFWVARVAELVAQRPQLDGVYLDNFWRQISWQQGQRRLDSDCNPLHNPSGCDGVPDAPARLDSLWYEGLQDIAALLRARFDALGSRRPIAMLSNGASDYFAWLNGTVYEFFPSGHADIDFGNPYGYNWNREMFDHPIGYTVAPFRGRPYRASILNSEYPGTRWEPARNPGFERHKRFTLGSSLLGDGYYSLDAGHAGNQNLWWEPEYDHAGRGKGYLGDALGPPARLLQPGGLEVLANPDFGAGTTGWEHYGSGVVGSASVDAAVFVSAPASLRIDVLQGAPAGSYKLWQWPIQVVTHEAYTLSFWARGSGELVVQLYSPDCPGLRCWGPRRFRLAATWTRFETSFRSSGSAGAGLDFLFAGPGSVWLDDVSLRRGDTALFRRDFEHGIVLLNYTNQVQLVPLEEPYQRLQVPQNDVFDGTLVSAESVPPSDARILLRATTADVATVRRHAMLAQNRPNPFNPPTQIRFHLQAPSPVHMAVYDVAGRLVRVLLQQVLPGDREHVVAWDGRDAAGRALPAGVYMVRMTTPAGSTARKMLLAH